MADVTMFNTLAVNVPTPPIGYTSFFYDETGAPKVKHPDGTVTDVSAIVMATAIPQPIGTGAVGVAPRAAREDHVHDHGAQAGGTLHAATIASGASGFLTGADKAKLDGIAPGAIVSSVSGIAPIVSSGGAAPSVSITAATAAASGSMSGADKAKLDGITPGAAVSSVGGTAPIISSGGSTPVISIAPATSAAAGSMGATDKAKLDTLDLLDAAVMQFRVNPGTATLTTIGMVAPTAAGTLSSADSNAAPQVNLLSSGAANSANGFATAFAITRMDWLPDLTGVLGMASAGDFTASRTWFGFTSADLIAVDNPTTQHVAAFRYSPGVDGTAFWRTVTCNGASGVTVNVTTVPIAASTLYKLRIQRIAGDGYNFYINGVLVATHSTNLPTSGQALGIRYTHTPTTTTAKNGRFSRWSLAHLGVDATVPI